MEMVANHLDDKKNFVISGMEIRNSWACIVVWLVEVVGLNPFQSSRFT